MFYKKGILSQTLRKIHRKAIEFLYSKGSYYLCFRALSPTTYYRRDEHQHDMSIQQVDGILQHLEQWLNNQTNGAHTDMSEVSSVIDSVTDDHSNPYVKYILKDRLPLELIDQIDATSV